MRLRGTLDSGDRAVSAVLDTAERQLETEGTAPYTVLESTVIGLNERPFFTKKRYGLDVAERRYLGINIRRCGTKVQFWAPLGAHTEEEIMASWRKT